MVRLNTGISRLARSMICRLTAMALCACLVVGAASAASPSTGASYRIDRSTLALGEPLILTVTRSLSLPSASLDALDLSGLAHDFEIQGRTLGRDSQQEDLVLTLYPRHVGRITLPSFGLDGRPPLVTVTDTSSTMPRVRFRVSVDPEEPLVRQASDLTIEACDDGTLQWKRPILSTTQGMTLRPINETEIITQRDGQRCTAHRWHWAATPTAVGRSALTLPTLEAGKFGTRLRFEPPAFEFHARPLPEWLPSEATVDAPEIVAEPLPQEAVIDRPIAWRVRVTGGYSTSALQALLALQMPPASDVATVAAYAPRVEPVPSLTVAPQHQVTLYLLPHQRGMWVVPDLWLPWYDPKTGQVERVHIPGSQIDVIDPIRQRWLMAGGLGAGLVLAFLGAVGLWKVAGWRFRRRQTLRKVICAQTPAEISMALRGFKLHRGDAPAATLRAWQFRIENQCTSQKLDALVDALERTRFGNSDTTINESTPNTSNTMALKELITVSANWLGSVRPRSQSWQASTPTRQK